jgi:catechol 2,3-dioxygenase-like lactoylglutathione lyase family enzyme
MAYLGRTTLVVDSYDRAISYYVDTLGFTLIEDTPMGDGKRWVVIAPEIGAGATLLIAQAVNDQQRSAIGNQTGGRVAFFLYTQDFDGDFQRLKEKGVQFIGEPRLEEYGKVIVFVDLYGNKWDFIEPKIGEPPA